MTSDKIYLKKRRELLKRFKDQYPVHKINQEARAEIARQQYIHTNAPGKRAAYVKAPYRGPERAAMEQLGGNQMNGSNYDRKQLIKLGLIPPHNLQGSVSLWVSKRLFSLIPYVTEIESLREPWQPSLDNWAGLSAQTRQLALDLLAQEGDLQRDVNTAVAPTRAAVDAAAAADLRREGAAANRRWAEYQRRMQAPQLQRLSQPRQATRLQRLNQARQTAQGLLQGAGQAVQSAVQGMGQAAQGAINSLPSAIQSATNSLSAITAQHKASLVVAPPTSAQISAPPGSGPADGWMQRHRQLQQQLRRQLQQQLSRGGAGAGAGAPSRMYLTGDRLSTISNKAMSFIRGGGKLAEFIASNYNNLSDGQKQKIADAIRAAMMPQQQRSSSRNLLLLEN